MKVNGLIKDNQQNVRSVVDADGKFVQQTDYYPYGMPKANSNGQGVNRYKYSSKEYETENGLNLYDFEARMHDPATCLFRTTDTKAGDYPWLNPYLYCAANPIANIDLTGNDYLLYIDLENNTITIWAEYFVLERDYESAKNATDEIELNPNCSDKESMALHSVSTQNGEGSNIYKEVESLDDTDLAGQTRGGNIVAISKENKTELTGAHELGHTLGLIHYSKGVMSPKANKHRSKDVFQWQINTIISGALRGQPFSEKKGNDENSAGAGIIRYRKY